MRARDSTRTMATGSPVGRAPMSGTWATTASWPSPARSSDAAVAGALGGLDGAAGLVGDEGEGDDRAGQHGGRQLGEREAGGRSTEVDDGGRLAHVSKDIDAATVSQPSLIRLDSGLLGRRVNAERVVPAHGARPGGARYGITSRGALTPSAPHSRSPRPYRARKRLLGRVARRRPRPRRPPSVAERPRNWMRWRPWSLQKNGTGAYGVRLAAADRRQQVAGGERRPARRRWSSARRASPRRTGAFGQRATSPAAYTPGGRRRSVVVADDAVAQRRARCPPATRSPAPRRCRRR